MQWCYLNSDVKGAYSKIDYGQQGDKIAIIGRQNEMIKVLHEEGRVFFIKEDLISIDFINKKPINQQDNGKNNQKNNQKSSQKNKSKKRI
jgi:hypothetical protein